MSNPVLKSQSKRIKSRIKSKKRPWISARKWRKDQQKLNNLRFRSTSVKCQNQWK